MAEVDDLVKQLQDVGSSHFRRKDAASRLGRLGDRRAVPYLINALKDSERYVRQEAAAALGKLGDPSAAKPLIEILLSDDDDGARREAANALGELRIPQSAKALTQAQSDKSVLVKYAASDALKKVQDQAASTPETVQTRATQPKPVRKPAVETPRSPQPRRTAGTVAPAPPRETKATPSPRKPIESAPRKPAQPPTSISKEPRKQEKAPAKPVVRERPTKAVAKPATSPPSRRVERATAPPTGTKPTTPPPHKRKPVKPTLRNLRPGGSISIGGEHFQVKSRSRYKAGHKEWFEYKLVDKEGEECYLQCQGDRELLITFLYEISFRDLEVNPRELDEFDEEEGKLEWEGVIYCYDGSGRAYYFEEGDNAGRPFDYWDFEDEEGERVVGVTRWGRDYEAFVGEYVDEDAIEVL